MEIYRFKVDYAKAKGIHIQTTNKRKVSGRLQEVTVNGKRVGFIDVLDVTKDYINNL